jgi:hypothetical protein
MTTMELLVESPRMESRLWHTRPGDRLRIPRDFVADLRTPTNFMADRLDSRVLHAQQTKLILHRPDTIDRPAKGESCG